MRSSSRTPSSRRSSRGCSRPEPPHETRRHSTPVRVPPSATMGAGGLACARTHHHMDLLARERDRMLQRAARAYGVGFTLVSGLCYVLPGALVDAWALPAGLALYAVLAGAQFMLGISRNPGWVLLTLLAGLGIVAVATGFGQHSLGVGGMTSVQLLVSGSLAAVAVVLTGTAWRLVSFVLAFAGLTAASIWLTASSQAPLRTGGLLLLGWCLAAGIGAWVSAGMPLVARRIASIGRAHRVE